MERSNIYVAVSIVLIILTLFILSGNWTETTGRLGYKFIRVCEETDGGDDIWERGEITYTLYGREKKIVDYCYARTGKSPKKWLKEYFCDLHGEIDDREYDCTDYNTTCEEGACKILEIPECKDTDDGLAYFDKGTACSESNCKVDFCVDENFLSERYCGEDGLVATDIYQCQKGCSGGACIK